MRPWRVVLGESSGRAVGHVSQLILIRMTILSFSFRAQVRLQQEREVDALVPKPSSVVTGVIGYPLPVLRDARSEDRSGSIELAIGNGIR